MLFSEPKIPQSPPDGLSREQCRRFSALQRAENSSMMSASARSAARSTFQCSSASRKFLNELIRAEPSTARRFQCSSASRKFLNGHERDHNEYLERVSVLFSEPKIPQSDARRSRAVDRRVSVLFSEPKIPQYQVIMSNHLQKMRFQCSSASRKFLNLNPTPRFGRG